MYGSLRVQLTQMILLSMEGNCKGHSNQIQTVFLQRELIYLLGTLHRAYAAPCAPGPVLVFASCPVSFYPWSKCIACKLLLLFHIYLFFPVSLCSSKTSVAAFKNYPKILFLFSRSFVKLACEEQSLQKWVYCKR